MGERNSKGCFLPGHRISQSRDKHGQFITDKQGAIKELKIKLPNELYLRLCYDDKPVDEVIMDALQQYFGMRQLDIKENKDLTAMECKQESTMNVNDLFEDKLHEIDAFLNNLTKSEKQKNSCDTSTIGSI